MNSEEIGLEHPTRQTRHIPLSAAPSAKEVTAFHDNDDVDGSKEAHHHTLGPGATQAASGNHTHDGGDSAELTDYAKVSALEQFADSLEAIEGAVSGLEGAVRMGTVSLTGDGSPVVVKSEIFGPAYSFNYNIPTVFLVSTHHTYHAALTGTITRLGFSVALRHVDSANWTRTVDVNYIAYATRI